MSRRMSVEDWQHVLSVEEFTHVEAHMVASEFVWGWGSVWFESTGQVGVPTVIVGDEEGAHAKTYADYLDRAFFGWWADQEDGRGMTDGERTARARFRAYVERREQAGDLGPVLPANVVPTEDPYAPLGTRESRDYFGKLWWSA